MQMRKHDELRTFICSTSGPIQNALACSYNNKNNNNTE